METDYILLNTGNEYSRPIKAWVNGVPVEGEAQKQLFNIASLTEIMGPHVAVMPDVHLGRGATVGSVIPTIKAIIPSAVGVDIGCGMCAVRLNIKVDDVFDLAGLRHSIERSVPVGFSQHADERLPELTKRYWPSLLSRLQDLRDRLRNKKGEMPSEKRAHCQLGTLGGGNHFMHPAIESLGPPCLVSPDR